MRPDAVNWTNTNGLSALEFRPKQLVYRRLTRWAVRTALLQAILGVTLSVGAWHLLTMSRAVRTPPQVNATAARTRAEPTGTSIPTGISVTRRVQPTSPAGTSAMTPPVKSAPHGIVYHAARRLAGLPDLLVVGLLAGGAQVTAFLLAQLVLVPIIRSMVRTHTSGLRDLFDAISSMASGVVPKPLAVGSPGEAGYLALAFNDMTSRLLANRRALIEANETLERRVEERTRELREANEKLEKMASTDVLTGLANRRALMQRGHNLFQSAAYEDSDLVVFLIDLDHFKMVNDTLGHKKGDELISLAATVLRNGCRTDDLAARLGGDEFIVLMPHSDLQGVSAKANDFQAEFQRQVKILFGVEALTKMPSMSIGMTSRRQAGATSFAELIQRADLALYRAKDLGRGRAEIYTPRVEATAA